MVINIKKISLLVGFIFLIAAIGFFIYALFFQPTAPTKPEITEITPPTTGGLPETPTGTKRQVVEPIEIGLPVSGEIPLPPDVTAIAKGGKTLITPITGVKAEGFTLSGDGKSAVFYHTDTGSFYQIDTQGRLNKLTDAVFRNVSNVSWSKNTQKAVLEYPDGSNIVYNFKTKQQVTLPEHWTEFSFSPNGEQIASKSIGMDAENRWIIISKDDGSAGKKVEYLGSNWNVNVDWSPNNQVVATYHEGYGMDKERLFFIGLNSENFKHTVLPGRGFRGKWSPKGDKIVYSVYTSSSGLRPQLWVVNAQGDNIGTNRLFLGLQTFVDKCAFSGNDTIYCGVPTKVTEGSGLFKEALDNTPDEIYRVDLNTGAKTLVAQPYSNVTLDQVSVTEDGKFLYFTDKQTGRLYTLQLK